MWLVLLRENMYIRGVKKGPRIRTLDIEGMGREEYPGDNVRKTGKSGRKVFPAIKLEGMSSRLVLCYWYQRYRAIKKRKNRNISITVGNMEATSGFNESSICAETIRCSVRQKF